jgi:hypothetical protein
MTGLCEPAPNLGAARGPLALGRGQPEPFVFFHLPAQPRLRRRRLAATADQLPAFPGLSRAGLLVLQVPVLFARAADRREVTAQLVSGERQVHGMKHLCHEPTVDAASRQHSPARSLACPRSIGREIETSSPWRPMEANEQAIFPPLRSRSHGTVTMRGRPLLKGTHALPPDQFSAAV